MLDLPRERDNPLTPQLQVRIETEEVEPTPDPLNNPLANDVDNEKTIQSPFDDGEKATKTFFVHLISLCRSENLPCALHWIPAHWCWSKWKPVVRSALAAWISLLLFLIPTTMKVMGQDAFLINIASFLSPPSEPFTVMLQRELSILAFASSGWAWSYLGIKLADIARSNKDPTASAVNIISGQYMEPAPTAVLAVFLFIGSFFFLYIKSCMPPGQVTFAYLFSCMLYMDISLTIAVLYPYPYYMFGKSIVLPLIFHSAVSLTLSLCFFPTSETAIFTTRLQDVLSFLAVATREHRQHLQQDVTSLTFSVAPIIAAVGKAESAVAALSPAARLQKFDIVYSRFAPTDYVQLYSLMRGLIVKASGMNMYYTLIDPTRERFTVTPVPSVPTTPAFISPASSRPPSPSHDHSITNLDGVNDNGPLDGGSERFPFHRHHSAPPGHHLLVTHHRKRRHHQRQSPSHHSSHSQNSHIHLALFRAAKSEAAVGAFESLHYLNLEATHYSHSDPEMHITKATELLSASCDDLLQTCDHGLQGVCDWLGSVRGNLFNIWLSREEKEQIRVDGLKKYEGLHRQLSSSLDEFMNKKRFIVCEPYRAMFTSVDDSMVENELPSHRHLFHCYVYQYRLMRFAANIQEALGEIIRLETCRDTPRIWLPRIHWSRWTHRAAWESSDEMEIENDEDPDMIPGMDLPVLMDLGQAVPRDPDALPPRNALERSVNWIHHIAKDIGGGNVLFALKAGILTIILSLPSFLESSAEFAFKNKFVWAVIMAQLTLSRFRGDTAFGFVTRITSTFIGGIIGIVLWYISTGSGRGNPFGLAAVCFICFPFIFFRLYWPVAPMINLIIWVTAALVFGYSYQDTHLPSPSSPGYGVTLAWKRPVLVIIGVTAAGIFSFLPPATTIRLYQRKTLATATAEIGTVYCSVISFASTKREGETTVIIQHLLAILNRLKRSLVLKEKAAYEFSLRGKWPAERYQRILELQIQIGNMLSHLTSVLEQMEPAWAQAFLRRTRLSDAGFEGDVLAVMSLISFSLRTGKALPQVTPCPLLHRFMARRHGLNVVHEEDEQVLGLPRALTEETLVSWQYLIFSVGVSTAFGIVTRLDKLMVAVKELVGERYHIDGLGLPLHYRRAGGGVERY